MGYPGRHSIYKATIRRMVMKALEAQEQEFRKNHASDTDEQLLIYLRACAFRLRHSPWPGEIVGSSMIKERFGSWTRALILARLPAHRVSNQLSPFPRVQEEVERQQILYRQKKGEKKQRAQKKRAEHAAKKKRPV